MGNSNNKKWDIYEKSGRIASAWIGKILKFQFIVVKTFPQGKVLSGDANRTINTTFPVSGLQSGDVHDLHIGISGEGSVFFARGHGDAVLAVSTDGVVKEHCYRIAVICSVGDSVQFGCRNTARVKGGNCVGGLVFPKVFVCPCVDMNVIAVVFVITANAQNPNALAVDGDLLGIKALDVKVGCLS